MHHMSAVLTVFSVSVVSTLYNGNVCCSTVICVVSDPPAVALVESCLQGSPAQQPWPSGVPRPGLASAWQTHTLRACVPQGHSRNTRCGWCHLH